MAGKSTALIRLNVNTKEFNNEFLSNIRGVNGFTFLEKEDGRLPDLLIHELGDKWEKDLDAIQSYLDTAEHTDVFIVSKKADPDILMKAMRIGVKEFFPAPLETRLIADALTRFKDRREKLEKRSAEKLGRIISIIGSKGGVGTTTIAVNLAACLALNQEAPSAALLDMNMVFGEVPVFLDMSPKHDWSDITKNIDRLDEFFLSNILSKHSTGLHILPSPKYLDNHPTPTPPIMENLLELMRKNYDFIIVDLGQSINETALKIIQMSELIQVVAIQTLPCLSNTSRLIKSLVEYGYTDKNSLEIVLNRYIKKGMVSLETAQEGVGRKMSWIIPNDYSTTMSAINSGQPLGRIAPKSRIVKSFNDYVEKLLPNKKEKKGWLF